jgi:hypothetical protein
METLVLMFKQTNFKKRSKRRAKMVFNDNN